jgi:rhodanese-related sulfurtransferase
MMTFFMGKDKLFWGGMILIFEYNERGHLYPNFNTRFIMKRLLFSCLLLLLCLLPVAADAAVAKNVSPGEAASLLEQRDDVFLLDVRTLGEFQQVRLKNARLIPIDQLVKRLAEVPKNRPVLVYCAVGSRSAQVVNYLARRGYPEIYNLYGGIYSWVQRGLPVLRGGP